MVDQLRTGLEDRGHSTMLLASDAYGRQMARPDDAICRGSATRLRGIRQVHNPSAVRALRGALAAFRPHVVHLNMFLTQLSPSILRPLAAVPTVFHAHWARAACPTGLKLLPSGEPCTKAPGRCCLASGCLRPHNWLLHLLQQHRFHRYRPAIRHIVANSRFTADALATAGLSPVEVLYYGAVVQAERPWPADPPCILYVGRLVPEKGCGVLIEAFGRIAGEFPSATLQIAGDGPSRPTLQATVAALPAAIRGRICFHGRVSHEALGELHSRAWIQVVPSIWPEPFGVVAIEAMMRGVAVVASDIGGLPEILPSPSLGKRVSPGDPHALAEAIRNLLLDPASCRRMGKAGREHAIRHFARDSFFDRMESLYYNLTGA